MNTPFTELAITGVFLARTARHADPRGWLCETFRSDWLAGQNLADLKPAMTYCSFTGPGVIRGPHEHLYQTDIFAFVGPSDFLVLLWDNRKNSPTFAAHLRLVLGENNPATLIVPPGVVHAYKNIGTGMGLVINHPDRLYRGENRAHPPDEIRYEDNPTGQFRVE